MIRFFVIMVGVPGSGKTTLRERLFPEAVVVCPDHFIGYTKESPWNPRAANKAWKQANKILQEKLRGDSKVIIFDATMTSPQKRRKYIAMAKLAGVTPVAIFCDTPEYLCRQRNAARDEYRKVPERTMDAMLKNLTKPSISEGFQLVMDQNGISGTLEDSTTTSEALKITSEYWSAIIKGGC